ncbi:long-chain fatty acid transport protein [Formosa sp. Hel1_31_208]|uniref:OmpP1/FadL family transporter n=1 Tax=Formosa sp. Hel1_31_208 TaxID=1798225 RepID=UPI0008794C5F|nr:outer membrane protein transport protein [Formosa sp. Hel1_31_208]SDS72336.1 long-chain fatty acid transport protein [Formosa sp. Hel1_31_208]
MRSLFSTFLYLLFSVSAIAQTGHIMQGAGSVNMSMGGAATAQPLDISGALQWNPAAISTFDGTIISFDIGLFSSSPTLFSTVPEFDSMGMPTGNFFSGVTEDDRGLSPMPALAVVWGKEGSKHTFGASAFGISGFGVTFPESMTNPINAPQSMGGFGRIESDYILLQIGFTWAYELSDNFSIGLEPTFNYATLELMPNPTANPGASGYPSTDKATATGFGGQIGLFYDSKTGFKAGLSYKSTQSFSKFKFDNTYLDASTGTNEFNMDYPAIYSIGLGYSKSDFDIALDYRLVDYENTDGFSTTGWTPTASVSGFGWQNISIVSAGVQYKGINKLPLRVGYTYSSNPINDDVAFFNIPATAIIKNAFQLGLTYEFNDRLNLNAVYHHGDSGGKTSGQILNPGFIPNFPPYGAIPGSNVSYEMTTDLFMIGFNYTFKRKEVKNNDL